MRRLLLIYILICGWLLSYAQHTIVVKAGDAESLLGAIEEANKLNADKQSQQTFVLIPNGYYDLGERVLTRITGHNIAFIGQNRFLTIIRNQPDRQKEGISKTAVLQNRGTGNYFQDLTLLNDMEYYEQSNDGRAVTLQDKGTRTICNRVRLLSHQDTYYSDNEEGQYYFQETEIHGTVDFICGAGDVWFDQCRLVTVRRTEDGSGRDVIAAPRTSKTQWGFIMNRCTIKSYISPFQFARGWHTTPHCIWLYTTLLDPDKLMESRFDPNPIRGVNISFKEYGTMDATGRDITPKSNVVTYVCKDEQKAEETIATPEEASQYTLKRVFGDWKPDKVLRQTEKKAKKMMKRL